MVRCFWFGELIEFDFVELVASFDAPGILAGCHLLSAETGGISDIIKRHEAVFGEVEVDVNKRIKKEGE